ncbi:hypothetical protein [Halorarum salinum]|uniref:Uncharacterized protein n=1 Tax=Halorarum salinum TaxID=2743089 RepID=A0A7D5LAK8_9EURY|nr:hypothetical protein [Halobaculum salinum]QLG61931.1 hypothetical protein HUG12_09440 [Halobaculum salinum]
MTLKDHLEDEHVATVTLDLADDVVSELNEYIGTTRIGYNRLTTRRARTFEVTFSEADIEHDRPV